ncbi:MAG TPA: transketolase [Steroidobacteraceae bacterium]|jgi:transketolase|nr:transketolase [Steroidobacteraceae bacterium]
MSTATAPAPTRRELANVLRVLAMDAVQQANSGHAGAPMGMADIAEVLWRDFLKHNPANPRWWDRDRFILSNGHACILLYGLLYLTGYPIGMDEIRHFRQLGSRLAGHPEHDPTIGIETTSGPLGQGLGNSVGFALAEKMLAAQFNRPGLAIVDHYTYVFMGDGDLMEGISHEACSLAGTLKLGKLIGFYDDNGISIDGKVAAWFADDTPRRFEAYGWHVQRVDGMDDEAVAAAIRAAQAETERPSLICCKTVIGWGAPTKAGTKAAHSDPLGVEEVAGAKKLMGWTAPPFEVPSPLRAAWNHEEAGRAAEARWQELFGRYRRQYPDLAADFERRMQQALPSNWLQNAQAALTAARNVRDAQATRKSSKVVLDVLAKTLPELFGGSADLTTSNETWNDSSRAIGPADFAGNYLHYGVREFGMTAAMNGLALHGGFIPYGGTFLTFSDYARNAVRMAALMHQRVILVYSHDSIGLGEDGPTHQPIEQLNSLRVVPNLTVWRPADAVETAVAWCAAIEHDSGPTALALSRQGLPQLPRDAGALEGIRRGGYVLLDCQGTPECIVIATGSEVALALEAVKGAQGAGHRVRLVSMPCTELFDAQEPGWREAVLPAAVTARIAVEAGSTALWWRYVGLAGRVIGIDHFGASGKGPDVFKKFGFTAQHVRQTIDELIA